MTEHQVLGTWSMDAYFGIHHPLAYLVAMSLVDGFYPIISLLLLSLAAKNKWFGVWLETKS